MSDHLQVAAEDEVVGYIEPTNGRVQSDVRLRDILPKQVWLMAWLCQMLLNAVQGLEQWIHIRVISLLRCGESGFVHSIVNLVIHPLIHCVNL